MGTYTNLSITPGATPLDLDEVKLALDVLLTEQSAEDLEDLVGWGDGSLDQHRDGSISFAANTKWTIDNFSDVAALLSMRYPDATVSYREEWDSDNVGGTGKTFRDGELFMSEELDWTDRLSISQRVEKTDGFNELSAPERGKLRGLAVLADYKGDDMPDNDSARTAIQDLLTDLIHVSQFAGLGFRVILDDARRIAADEITNQE